MGPISAKLVGFITPRERSRTLSAKAKADFLSNNPLWTRFRTLSEEEQHYQLKSLVEHLSMSSDSERLYQLLTDINFLSLKLIERGIEAVEADFAAWVYPPNPMITTLKQIWQLSASILLYDPTQLPEQLLARLMPGELFSSFLHTVSHYKSTIWLRPMCPSLVQPVSPLVRTIPLTGHNLPTGVAFTQDQKQILVTVGSDLYCFNRDSGTFLFSCAGDEDDLTDLTVTRNGLYAVATSRNGTLTVWHLGMQKQLAVLVAHESAALAVQPVIGSSVITASTDGTLKRWDVALAQETLRLEGHTESANSVVVLADGKTAISGGGGSIFGSREHFHLKIWDLEDGKEIGSFGDHEWTVDTLAVVDKWVVSAANEWIKIWDLNTHEQLQYVKAHDSHIHKLQRVDTERVISASTDNDLKVWHIPTAEKLLTLRGHHALVCDVAVTQDGQMAASIGWDQNLRLWNLNGRDTHRGHEDKIEKIIISPDERWVVTASMDHTIKIWDSTGCHEQNTLIGHQHWVSDITISADGRRLISGSWDGSIKIWSLETGLEEFTLVSGMDPISAIALHSDHDLLIVGTIKGEVTVWELKSRIAVRTFQAGTRAINALTLTPDGRYMLSICGDAYLKLWHPETGQLIHEFEGHTEKEALARTDDDDERLFIHLRTSELMTSLVVTRDGRYAITGAMNGAISIWDLEHRHLVSNFQNRTSGISSISVSNDSQYIAAAVGVPHYQSENKVTLWSTATRQALAYFVGDAPMTACVLTRDSKMLIVGDTLGSVHFLAIR